MVNGVAPIITELIPIISIIYDLPSRYKTLVGLLISAIIVFTVSFLYSIIELLWENLFVNCRVMSMINLCYPTESLFYPYPFFGLLTVCILLIIFYNIIKFVGKKGFLSKINLPKSSDAISATGVAVTIIVLFLPYFALTPLLDYDVTIRDRSNNSSQLNAAITNYGLVPAKYLILSIEGNNNFKFLQLTTDPIQKPISFYSENNNTGSTFYEIDTLPPRTTTIVKADLLKIGDSPNIITYLRSSETNGYHGVIYMGLVYLMLLIPIFIWVFNRIIQTIIDVRKLRNVYDKISMPNEPQK